MFNRSNQNIISRWWYTVDRVSVAVVLILLLMGIIAVATASPPVALRIGGSEFFFLKKHLIYVVVGVSIMIAISLLTPKQLKILSLFCMCFFACILIATPIFGIEIKGARRWISIMGMQIQPSELLRPWLVIITTWLLDIANVTRNNIYYIFFISVYIFVTICLLAQPDVGMTMMVSMVWLTQLFISRLNFIWIMWAGAFFSACGGISYAIFPHVRRRVYNFLHSEGGDNYQINKSLEAFSNGGLFGTGPGQGHIKNYIPDSHSDFIFSVVAEEFGLFSCLAIMFLFIFFSFRSIFHAIRTDHNFCIGATIGLVLQLQTQVIINIGVVTHLLPTTGITLPLISYGGSSMLATFMTIGATLALTKSTNKAVFGTVIC